jgi:hypothetical protein
MVAVPRHDRTGNTDPVASVAIATDSTHLKLRAIDRALQTAYARGASDAEVAPLWATREQLMRAMPASEVEDGNSAS